MFVVYQNGVTTEVPSGMTPIDSELSLTSTNPVENRKLYENLPIGTSAQKNFTTVVTQNNGDVVTSGGVYSYISNFI